jgi:hypothetical protein
LTIPWGDEGAVLRFYLSEGRLMGRLTVSPEAPPDAEVVLLLRIDCSPLFAWTDLSAPVV